MFNKALLFKIPEYILLTICLFYWVAEGIVFNPLLLFLIVALSLQTFFRNRIVGIAISVFLAAACLFMLGALVSELKEFPTFNSDAQVMLVTGLFFFLTLISLAGIMLYRELNRT